MTNGNKKRRMRSTAINIESKRKYWRGFSFTSLALSVGSLVGCGQSADELSIHVYKDLASCQNNPKNTIAAQCETTYQAALREAERTSQKFRQKAMCELEYGECEAMPGAVGYRPKMAAFMMAAVKPEQFNQYDIAEKYRNVFYQPLFTSTSGYGDLYRKLFFADGKVIGDYSDIGNIQYEMNRRYLHPLETVRLPMEKREVPQVGTNANVVAGINPVLNSRSTAYIASGIVDEIGDYSARKHRERMYRERLIREKEQKFKSSDSRYSGYDSKPIVTTKSSGGFGSTSSAKYSWGG
ncbi:DUF1190 domain-containing protein [Photorhabdus laumondii]|uniref:Photorhabdus luminescens subsp. laumondii TTO1 complete genome segment 15/17 n=1 Tax=Photorhabdus laumondii subsp. laumondii (strain DSM 15139 / CIP 105565 / TT01) TaxID=243265 RepID=Q7MZH7_PHOLL|nr:DUF1190 domain-containing protein [Photorhabdus laumondii]AXG49176.1 DUF1190 domain-containing protein [Photorhabdus laumondii subsp. laumondii]CAE16682.1 unnamed protein product [Photorhabdus laumondii subsp. laumondii TTO1]